MFSKLPELFARNFILAYFLPVIAFLSASLILLKRFDYLAGIEININGQGDLITGTIWFILISWFLGIALLVTNRSIIRIMEGYGRFNPLSIFSIYERTRYRRINNKLSDLEQDYLDCKNKGKEFLPKDNKKRIQLMLKLAEQFPDKEQLLLPTSFGNVIRAFETYSRIMYGLDAIPGWDRLLAVIPANYSKLIDDAKSYVDFWVNLGFFSLIFLFEYLIVVLFSCQIKLVWIPIATTGIGVISYFGAKTAAIDWGSLVKSSFDVFLPDLAKKIGFSDIPGNREVERALWHKFSQSVIYVKPEIMPNGNNQEKNRESKDKT